MTKPFAIYRSSAGSGKTRTLAREYLRLALSRKSHYFRHILAVTFTNKATQEMKDRILAYLDDFANGRPGDLADELKSTLKLDDMTFQQFAQETQSSILHGYSDFSISTIDAFFQKVIRSFTREAGLTGDYRLEVDADPVLEEVVDSLIDELGTKQELTDWVVEFATENLENERSWDIRYSLLEFAREIFREEFKQVEAEVNTATAAPDFFRGLRKRLLAARSRFVGEVNVLARESLALMAERPWTVEDINYKSNSGLFTFLEMCAGLRRAKDFEEPKQRMRQFAADPAAWPQKKSPHAGEIFKLAKSDLAPRLAALLRLYDEELTEALSAEVALQNLYVFGLVSDISRKLAEYKNENNVMLLADAPQFLQGVIQDSDTPFIYEKTGSFYRNFLIDEFQDTSGLQWANFLPLLANGLDQGHGSLVVGDVKQAIYRWRGGDLSLLQQRVGADIGGERTTTSVLASNYRSGAALVAFNNAFFEHAARTSGNPLAEDAYRDVAQHAARSEDEGYVSGRFLADEKDGDSWREMAFNDVRANLEKLQDHGIPLRDIAILVRRNEEGQEIIGYLQHHRTLHPDSAYRYDVVSGESLRIDAAATVNCLEGAMKYLVNPDDDIARAQLAFEFARLYDAERPLTEVFPVTNQAVFESYLPQAFTREKAALKKMPLIELTENLIRIFRLGDHPGEITYLQAFQNIVLDFYTRERNDLGAFLVWWENNKHKKSIPVSGDVDAARIITIHKSKGLQFPYVLIPFCSWSMDHDTLRAPQLWVRSESELFRGTGFLPVRYGSALERTVFREYYEEERTRTWLDNLNLMYVAFTRAESGMFVTAPAPGSRGSKNSAAEVLFQGLSMAADLAPRYDAPAGAFASGALRAASRRNGNGEGATAMVSLGVYPVSAWRDKLVIRRAAIDFFSADAPARQRINYGIYLHAVLSAIRTTADVDRSITSLVTAGVVADADVSALRTTLDTLFADPRISGWFSAGWEVHTEVPILLPDGSENRIDRLLVRDRKAVVIDFKTGQPSRDDHRQVMDYMNIVRQMNYTDIEGYLLYLKTAEVVSVTTARQKPAKKKDQSQLDLGL